MAADELAIWNAALQRLGDRRIEPETALTGDTIDSSGLVTTTTNHGYATGDRVILRGTADATAIGREFFRRVLQIDVQSDTTFMLEDVAAVGSSQTTNFNVQRIPATTPALEAFAIWPSLRNEVLEAHSWNEAVKRSRLARKSSTVRTVLGATAANPIVCTTSASHGYSSGDTVLLEAFDEMVEVNDRWFQILVLSATTFSIPEDGTSYTAETTGGTATKALTPLRPDSEYTSRFDLPSDCLRILELANYTGAWVREQQEVLCDTGPTVPIRYLARIKDVTKYDAQLDSVMAARMHWALAERLTQSNTKIENAQREFLSLLSEARGTDGQEQSPMDFEADTLLLSRRGIFTIQA